MKYKVGDKVRIIGSHFRSGIKTDTQHIVGKVGTIQRIDADANYPYLVISEGEGFSYIESDLAPLKPRTLDDLEVGDIVVNTEGDESKVLAVLPSVFFRSARGDFERAGCWYTISEAKANGWTLKQTEPEETTTELTIKELEERLDMEAGTLRIKK